MEDTTAHGFLFIFCGFTNELREYITNRLVFTFLSLIFLALIPFISALVIVGFCVYFSTICYFEYIADCLESCFETDNYYDEYERIQTNYGR